jgi:uncharacterized YigZ family protein
MGMTFTLAQTATYHEDIKKSRFVAIAAPVSSIEQAQQFLAEHHDATTSHQCWAWKINGQSRVNDDGEPSGTAGRPILAVIEGHQLNNVIILVNRWYGGVKLGTGGLARAYAGSAAQCLLLADKIPLLSMLAFEFYCDYKLWQTVQYHLEKLESIDYAVSYVDAGLMITGSISEVHSMKFKAQLSELSKGQIQLRLL